MMGTGMNELDVLSLLEERDALRAERDALRERKEVLGDQLDKINDDLTSTMIERDALRALLREAERAIADLVNESDLSANTYLDLTGRIDAALAKGCTCLGNDDIGHTGSCPRL